MAKVAFPAGPNHLVLENEKLRIAVALPHRYQGNRFCRGAFITNAVLKTAGSTVEFCARELPTDPPGGPYAGGVGLCGEFGIFKPVGYKSAEPGDWFPKLGTGLLRREDNQDFRFAADYEMRPFQIEVHSSPTALSFVTQPWEVRGYAAKLEQTLQLEGPVLTIATTLENLGNRPLNTHEYRHNFLAPAGLGPDQGTTLHLPFEAEIASNSLFTCSHQSGSTVLTYSRRARRTYFHPAATLEDAHAGSWWQMTWPASGVRLREAVSLALSRFHLYGTPSLVSPEAFVDISVAPGDQMHWTRSYTFSPLP